LKTSLEETKNV